jgi:peroxiredoxin
MRLHDRPRRQQLSRAARRELATELARDVLPQLQGTGTKLFLFSIGTPERGKEFAKKTGFPEDLLLADPKSETYAAVRRIHCGCCSAMQHTEQGPVNCSC